MAIARGPAGQPMCGTRERRQEREYQDAVGESLLQVAQAVPDGMLVFLASYGMLHQLRARWTHTGKHLHSIAAEVQPWSRLCCALQSRHFLFDLVTRQHGMSTVG